MRPLVLLLLVMLAGCVARPPDIPVDASAHWGLKEGFYWTWTRGSKHGCAAWMAKDEWADVQLLVGTECEGARESGNLPGRGASYFSVTDQLEFSGYWPWSPDDYFNLIVFDDQGMVREVLPCPYALSAPQIGEMKLVAREALADARTDGEVRILTRVEQRLAVMDGAKLASGQSGCNDHDPSAQAVDVWISPQQGVHHPST